MVMQFGKGQGGCHGRPSMSGMLDPAELDDEMVMYAVQAPPAPPKRRAKSAAKADQRQAPPAQQRPSAPEDLSPGRRAAREDLAAEQRTSTPEDLSPGRRTAREDLAAVFAEDDAAEREQRIVAAAQEAVRACGPLVDAAEQMDGSQRMWAFSSLTDQVKAVACAELFGDLMDEYDYRSNRHLREETIQSLSAALHKWHMDDPQTVTGHSAESVIVRAISMADLAGDEQYDAQRPDSGRSVTWDLLLSGPGLGNNHPLSVKAYATERDRFQLRLLETDLGPDPKGGFMDGVQRIADEHLAGSRHILMMMGRADTHPEHGSILRYEVRLVPTKPLAEALRALQAWEVTEQVTEKNGKRNTTLSAKVRLGGENGQLAEIKYLTTQNRFFLNFDSTVKPATQVASIPVAHPEQLQLLERAAHQAIEER